MDLDIEVISCDFEVALINSITEQFPETFIAGIYFFYIHIFQFLLLGCLFHFKQALRRKMIKCKIPHNEILSAMVPGMIDLLCLVPPDEILLKGRS